MQKTQKCFGVSFLRPPSGIINFDTSLMPPPFENFLVDALNSEQKLSVKNGRLCRSETGQPAQILKFTGRVEKILTGSISDSTNVQYVLNIKIIDTFI